MKKNILRWSKLIHSWASIYELGQDFSFVNHTTTDTKVQIKRIFDFHWNKVFDAETLRVAHFYSVESYKIVVIVTRC